MQIKIPSSVTVAKENAFLGANNCVITIGEGIDKNFEHGWNASCKVVKIKL